MSELIFQGYKTTTSPIADGDVAVVIRKDGTVEAAVLSANEEGTEVSADSERILTAYALMTLCADDFLLNTAKKLAMDNVKQLIGERVTH